MKKLLLTGFEPFLNFPINPTQKIADELHGMEIGGYKIIVKSYRSISVFPATSLFRILKNYNQMRFYRLAYREVDLK